MKKALMKKAIALAAAGTILSLFGTGVASAGWWGGYYRPYYRSCLYNNYWNGYYGGYGCGGGWY